MSDTQLSAINIYPIKSMAGISLSSAYVSESGICFDRRFMLSDPEGELISARQLPEMLHFQALIKDDGLEVIAPDGDHLTLRYPELFQNYRQVTVWGTEINAQHCGIQFDEWLSEKLGRPCQLLYFGEQSQRTTATNPDKPVAFADGYPLLIISEASLADLNSRSQAPVTMEHFRSNLVVKNCEAFAEDSWKRIRIGEVEFEIVKPCSRCVLTTVDPITLNKVAHGEPVKTLANYRMLDNEVYFGQNLIPLNEGQIKETDRIEVLETKAPEQYLDNAPLSADTLSPKEQSPSQHWKNEEEIELSCIARIKETVDVVTFRFALPDTYKADYLAGQFITLNLTIDGQPVSRCYTLSSSPNRDTDIAITVKRVTHGQVSNWLHDNLQVGDKVQALAPLGEFNQTNGADKPVLLLSAGSGITPMLSIARELTDTHSERDIIFYHQARKEADLICEDELLWLARQNSKLHLLFSLSQPEKEWEGIKGRINEVQLAQLIPDLAQRAVLCCGPEGFMQHAKEFCLELGLPEDNWFEESFGQPPGIELETEVNTIKLTVNGSSFQGENQSTLLEQAEDSGISIPAGCRSGVCGACKVTLESGEMHRSSEIPLSEAEKEAGIILACSCVPETDCEISF
ncbi:MULTISPECIES: hybrid-cluster NAD(P)-dependent oxidoreductase [unclassified Neptuniibacter]|uniref:hybrid-cluster NAD(P)-dependent oxidoreductase n=1 Tax=unclassified Neptuniibacter TaxID=2630693 RepID=UPI0025D643E1|nr:MULTISPECIES: hybrid-cluster NAD(P)-dependent oxidoreductase [unclassified Neptuniibacter]